MNNKDEEIFLKYLTNVKPIKKKNTIQKKIKKLSKKITKKNFNENPKEEKTTKSTNAKTPKYKVETNKTNKLLKKGLVRIDKKIDFHGKTVFEAQGEFINEIKKNYNQNKRCLLFVTGKGLVNKESDKDKYFLKNQPKLYYGKIRNEFLEWTKKTELSKYILNVQAASAQHGGDGAFYVYLRKKKLIFNNLK